MTCVCYSDYESPEFYRKSVHTAQNQHRCYECGHAINHGEKYELVAAKWEGQFSSVKTCPRCLALRDFTQSNVPCVCWAHGSMLEDCMETIREYRSELPGMFFGAARLYLKAIGRIK